MDNEFLLYHGSSDTYFTVSGEEERDKAIASGNSSGGVDDVSGSKACWDEYKKREEKNKNDPPPYLPEKTEENLYPNKKKYSEQLKQIDRSKYEEKGETRTFIPVGDGSSDTYPSDDDDAAYENIKTRAYERAMEAGFKAGVLPLYDMFTPKGRKVKFPFPTARAGQLEWTDSCIDILESGKNCLFEAGTGAGKSAVAVAVSTYFKDSWLLVGRNDLIDQWQSDFEKYDALGFYKSRQRFQCQNSKFKADGSLPTCGDRESCHKREKIFSGNQKPCPYSINRDMALLKSHTACTLALGLTMFKFLGSYPLVRKRALMVVDECSELESELIKFHTCTISTKTLKKALSWNSWNDFGMPVPEPVKHGDHRIRDIPSPEPTGAILAYLTDFIPKTLDDAKLWAFIAQDALEKAVAVLSKLQFKKTGNLAGVSDEEIAELEGENKHLIEICENTIRQIKTLYDALVGELPYCFETKESEDRWGRKTDRSEWQLILKPLEARGLFNRLLSLYADKFLFVSATTGSAENFMSAHGMTIPMQRVEAPSPFPIERRQVLIYPAGSLSKKTYDSDLPLILERCYKLADMKDPNGWLDHCNQRGVIHTFTNKLTNSIEQYLINKGLEDRLVILSGSGRERELAMGRFKSIKNGILISPSAMLGLSLNDDLARWQIVAKMPYAYLGDESVKYRMENIDGWYNWQTAKDLIQTFGRVCRSMDDWGFTYIIDEAFCRFYINNRNLFPEYVRGAIKYAS